MSGQLIRNTLKQGRLYKTTLFMLILLWLLSGVLIVWMVFYAPGNRTTNERVSLDDMLLSLNELKLSTNATLINLQLKEISHKSSSSTAEKQVIADDRKKIYNSILEQKIKTPASDRSGGFTIKPVPQ